MDTSTLIDDEVDDEMDRTGEFSPNERFELFEIFSGFETRDIHCFSRYEIMKTINLAASKKHKMSGCKFRQWLVSEGRRGRKRFLEVQRYVKWWAHFHRLEAQEIATREKAKHQARMSQIENYCQVSFFQLVLTTETQSTDQSRATPRTSNV
jgi:hypothetical protein